MNEIFEQARAGAAARQGDGRQLPGKRRRSVYTWFAASVRWLHLYVSLLGFTALLFFAFTGITLNHPTWFGGSEQHVRELEGEMNLAWLRQDDTSSAALGSDELASDESGDVEPVDYAKQVDKLAIVEHLRNEHRIRGAVSEFRADEYECLVIFKSPGYAADAFVDRETGHYMVTETAMGPMAIMNDLHKGRDSGVAWSLVIDITAIVMVFVSITGLVLIFYLRRKRRSGVVTAVVGTIVVALVYVLWVP